MVRISVLLPAALAAIVLTVACQPQKPAPSRDTDSPVTTETAMVKMPEPDLPSGTEAASHIRLAVPDRYNPDVSDEDRRTQQPKRGGELVVRVPGDISTLNPLRVSWSQEVTILSYLLDYLLVIHGETFELLPKLAAWYNVRDYVEKQDGTRMEGLVTTETAETVTLAPGAAVWTFLKTDITSSDTEAGRLQTRFGHDLRGTIQSRQYTTSITEDPTTPPVTINKSELSTWISLIGDTEEERPSIKRNSIIEMRLRDGVTWHDGHPVTMEDARTWFDTLRNPGVDAGRFRNYYVDIETLELPDEMTAKFTYRQPYFKAVEVCGGINMLPTHILQPERFADNPEGYAEFFNKHPMGQPGEGQFVGTGPYKLDYWKSGQELALIRNEDYWGRNANLGYWDPQQPYLDRIVFRVIPERTPALREMEIGNVDVDFDIEPDVWMRPQTNSEAFTSKFVRAQSEFALYTYVGWNMERDLFKDPKVRRALTMLTPREMILEQVHYGLGAVAQGPFYKGLPWADPDVEQIPYDPEGAKRLLQEARWIDRDGDGILDKEGQKFEFEYLIHTGREYHSKIADLIKQALAEAGIVVNIRRVEIAVIGEMLEDHNFDAVRMAWGGVPDPDPYQVWHSSQAKGRGSNYVSYDSPEVDALIEQAREVFDPLERWSIMRRIYRIIHADQPYTFMFHFDQLTFYNRDLRGVKFYLFDPTYDLTEWWYK